MKIKPFLSFILVGTTSVIWFGEALAVPNPPSALAADVKPESFNLTDDFQPKAKSSIKNQIPLPEGAKPTEGMESVLLYLNEITVVGLKTYSKANLESLMRQVVAEHSKLIPQSAKPKPVVQSLNGKGDYRILIRSEVSLSFAYLLSQAITKLYQDNQFFLSRAVIPAQDIDQKNGKIEICAIEGRIAPNLSVVTKGTTTLVGDSQKLKGLKSSIFNRLKRLTQSQQGALQFGSFERQLLLIRDMPGVSVSTTFKQPALSKNRATSCAESIAQGAGTTELSVAVALDQFDGAISVDNYGTEATGPWFLRMNFAANSQIVSGDRYALDVSVSKDGKELKNYGISASLPLNRNGTSLKSSFRVGSAAPGASFAPLEVDNETQTISLGIEHAIKRSRRQNASFDIGLKHQNIDTELLGVQFLKDRIRSANSSFTYDFANQNGGIHYAVLEITKGLDVDNATQKGSVVSSRPEADPNFLKVTGEYRYYKSLTPPPSLKNGRLTWVNSIKAQYADEPLFASEEFELGGRSFGRGADIGIISGDKGVAVKSQLDYEFKRWGGDVKVSGFVDHGKAWNLDSSNIGTDDEEAYLTTTGLSFGYESSKDWYLNLELSKPLEITGTDRDESANVYMGLGYRF